MLRVNETRPDRVAQIGSKDLVIWGLQIRTSVA